MTRVKIGIAALLLLSMAACGRGEEAASEGEGTAPIQDSGSVTAPEQQWDAGIADPVPADAQAPVEVGANSVVLGTGIDSDRLVQPKNVFSTTETVHAAAAVPGGAGGARANVYWTYQDGRTHHEEERTISPGAKLVVFTFGRNQGLQPGAYNVQIDINDQPVGISDFRVE
jgi:hypothetical protein